MHIGGPELILFFLTGLGPIVLFVFVMVILWKIMKAQESIAESVREMAKNTRKERIESPGVQGVPTEN